MKSKAKDKAEIELANSENKGAPIVIDVQFIAEIGDKLAKREKYERVSGLEAVHYYLMQKHHWPPKRIRAMKVDDLYFCLKEEKV
jgi:hypothetical protein